MNKFIAASVEAVANSLTEDSLRVSPNFRSSGEQWFEARLRGSRHC